MRRPETCPSDRDRRTRRLLVGLLVGLVMGLLGGCSAATPGADDRGADPAGTPTAADPGPMPTAPPAAVGEVVTRTPATVMDTGSPELCLGAVAESYPPQCSGPAVVGWDWADHGGAFEQVGDVRWGEFVVAGRWDGTSLTLTSARAAAPGDRPVDDAPHRAADHGLTPERLAEIAEEIGDLGGSSQAYATASEVLVDVPYDDGSLQAWADAAYGAGVVVVTGALVDA